MTFLRNAILVLVVMSASWSAQVEAQLGCIGVTGCELRDLCTGEEDCRATGALCDGGFCVTGGTCLACCVAIPNTVSARDGARCSYEYPCGILVNPASTVRSQPTTCFHDGDWALGDCDGDGNINGPLATFREADCAQLAAVIDGNIVQVAGSLATSCSVAGAVGLGDDSCAYARAGSPMLIGRSCDVTDICGTGGRCVLDPESVPMDGVCVYPRVDDGRLTPTDEMTCFDGRCVDRPSTGPSSFANGDCDEDGLTNRVDPDVCDPVRAVNITLSTNPVVVSAVGMLSLSPVHRTDGLGFAFDCNAGRQHCPILEDGIGELVHCVELPGEGVTGSACTYGLGPLPDRSCLVPGAPFSRMQCAFDGSSAYESWAEGDCDGDGEVNKLDELVCDATPVPSDAAVTLDAGRPLFLDGGSTNVDAARVDTADGGRIAFGGGGGCACRAQAGSGHGWMLILFAFAPMLRRARTRKV